MSHLDALPDAPPTFPPTPCLALQVLALGLDLPRVSRVPRRATSHVPDSFILHQSILLGTLMPTIYTIRAVPGIALGRACLAQLPSLCHL